MLLPDSALRSMRVMFATPCYIQAVSMTTVTSLFSLSYACANVGMACVLHMHAESLVPRARNRMVATFLEEESYTHLFWIDADVAFAPEAVFRILRADRDVAAGIYPMKTDPWPEGGPPAGLTREAFAARYTEFPFNPIGHGADAFAPHVDADGFVEVAEAPTGFMAIKRHVFQAMIAGYPDLAYVPDGPPDPARAHLHWLFFDCMVEPGSRRYLSEDYAFCRRWRDLGGRIHADLHADLQHLGQRMHAGNLGRSLRARGLL